MFRHKQTHQRVGYGLFLAYLVVLVYFMFFSDRFGRSGHEEYSYNVVLFREIGRFFRYRKQLGMQAFLLNTLGNVACFIPLGMFLPLLSDFGKKWYNTLGVCFLMTFGIETIQLLTKVGSFDVDDMFLNLLGGAVGWLIAWGLSGFGRRIVGK